MYNFLLAFHSGIRWIILLAAAVVILKSLVGLFGGLQYKKLDNILAASFVGTVHLQILTGLILYVFLSPITTSAFGNMSEAMSNDGIRYWVIEHISVMILAGVAAQVGRTISKKTTDSVVKFRFQSIFFSIALFLMLTRIPWDRL